MLRVRCSRPGSICEASSGVRPATPWRSRAAAARWSASHRGRHGSARSAPALRTATSQPNISFAQPATAHSEHGSCDGSIVALLRADRCDKRRCAPFLRQQGEPAGEPPLHHRRRKAHIGRPSAHIRAGFIFGRQRAEAVGSVNKNSPPASTALTLALGVAVVARGAPGGPVSSPSGGRSYAAFCRSPPGYMPTKLTGISGEHEYQRRPCRVCRRRAGKHVQNESLPKY